MSEEATQFTSGYPLAEYQIPRESNGDRKGELEIVDK